MLRNLPGSVVVQDGFAIENRCYSDCIFSFEARSPQGTEQVQIWAGIRCRDRDSRYVFALRGGNNDDVYLARYGPDGAAKFLGIHPLGFHPEPGVWYRIKAIAHGNRLLIYLNDEDLPRLNVVDPEVPWSEGGVSVGGGWLSTEYRKINARELGAPEERSIATAGDSVWQPPLVNKDELRIQRRAAYLPVRIDDSGHPRVEQSLDGQWLFLPDHELPLNSAPQSEQADDAGWHVMDVPNFWTPTVSWLYGETGFPELSGLSASKGICDRFTEVEYARLDGYTFDWRQTKSAWYRQYLDLPASTPGRRYEICFDAIAKVSDVWLNGIKVGSHVGMFGEVRCDITHAVKPGRNVLAVEVQAQALSSGNKNNVVGVAVTVEVTEAMLNSLPHGMYPTDAGGIWQPVKLLITNEVSIEDVYLRPRSNGMDFDVTVLSTRDAATQIEIGYVIRSVADSSILHAQFSATSLIAKSGLTTTQLTTPILEPKLWWPHDPNLYGLEVAIKSGADIRDRRLWNFGFRTFSVEKNKLQLNGHPFWLRGANHFPNALRPNDSGLARRFMQLAKDGNVSVTRSHTVPFSSCWLDAADEVGMAVSFEGTWPWLMLRGPVPSEELLHVWKEEFLSMIRKFRNHPSIILWTINNEMKFPELDRKDPTLLRQKWLVVSDMVHAIRAADPTRPVICDSSYCRNDIGAEYRDLVVPEHFDDGDIDDAHCYFGWYERTFYHFFRGEFGKSHCCPGRPLISQEMSTGYARNDDGHPVRFYLFQHHTPQSLVGYEAYENRDPAIFLRRQAFMTKELAEAFRRSNREECSGVLHFSYVSWFQNVWNTEAIQPFPTYFALRTALQPILVSAELYGRHFYTGTKFDLSVCVVNDAEDHRALHGCKLVWEFREGETVLASGSERLGDVPYYSNAWSKVPLVIPDNFSGSRADVVFLLKLEVNGVVRSENGYEVVLAKHTWSEKNADTSIAIVGGQVSSTRRGPLAAGRHVQSLNEVRTDEILIVADAEAFLKGADRAAPLRQFIAKGGRVLLLHAQAQLPAVFPDQVKSFRLCPGEIVQMHVPESRAFDGLETTDLAWFEMGDQHVPRACQGVYQLQPDHGDALALAEVVDIHGYLQKPSDLEAISGSPLVEFGLDKGKVLASEMMLLEAVDDPIADRLLSNLLTYLSTPAEM
ncbi:MAG TPA: glycoside hydrolase family 2 TIM barrel-domain containing protein [Terracidiphilus sp.]